MPCLSINACIQHRSFNFSLAMTLRSLQFASWPDNVVDKSTGTRFRRTALKLTSSSSSRRNILSQRVLDRILDIESTDSRNFMKWLETLKKASRLSLKSWVKLPKFEVPFVAALLKHSGLWRHVDSILSALDSGSDPKALIPSGVLRNFEALLIVVRDVRKKLRQQRVFILRRISDGKEDPDKSVDTVLEEEILAEMTSKTQFLLSVASREHKVRFPVICFVHGT